MNLEQWNTVEEVIKREMYAAQSKREKLIKDYTESLTLDDMRNILLNYRKGMRWDKAPDHMVKKEFSNDVVEMLPLISSELSNEHTGLLDLELRCSDVLKYIDERDFR